MDDVSYSSEEVGLLLCTRGEQTVLINGQRYVQRAGMLCIKSPIFLIEEVSRSADFKLCTILSEVNVIFPIIRASIDIAKDFRILEHPCIEVSERLSAMIVERAGIIEARRTEIAGTTDRAERYLLEQSTRLFLQQTFADFILMYYREYPVATTSTDKNAPLVFQFVFSLHEEFRVHRSVQHYADRAHLSTGHFSSIVKNVLGCTPSEMIALITVANIKLMLRQTDKSIKEIADELNFPEQFTFRKYFKHHTGMSPREYRRH